MQNQELQDEEKEVLLSIYDGDPAFKQLSPNTYQYKYGEDGDPKSFLLELKWGEAYPDEIPVINMDTFYNKHLVADVRAHIVSEVAKEAANNVGFAMTFTLFEWVKEKAEELSASQPEILIDSVNKVTISDPQDTESQSAGSAASRKPKKEAMSKSQKRKQWDRMDKGERPRGHDWVDVIKHLSQTGGKDSADSTTPTT